MAFCIKRVLDFTVNGYIESEYSKYLTLQWTDTQKVKVKASQSEVSKSCLTLCNPMYAAHQAPLSMGFLRQEYWSGLSFPSPGDLPDPGIESRSCALADGFFTIEPLESPQIIMLDIGNTVCVNYTLTKLGKKHRSSSPLSARVRQTPSRPAPGLPSCCCCC